MHTVRQMRQGALWIPELRERSQQSEVGDGGAGVVARARARAKDILATHEVEPLPDDASRHLEEIVDRARRELVPG
jgi:trimethylamine:corrinoid methyltransferase-like protein